MKNAALPQSHADVIARYQKKLDTHRASVKRCDQRWSSIGYLRGSLFLLSAVPFFFAINEAFGVGWPWLYLSLFLFVAFLVVAYIHEGMQAELKRASLLVKIYRESIARCQRDWDNIDVPDIEVERSKIALSTDLDLFTHGSIFKLLGITRTPLGTSTLKQWILDGAPAAEVELRQDAVRELAQHIDWREDFQLTCEQLAAGQSGPNRFIHWVQTESWFKGRGWVLLLARVASVVALVAIFGLLLVTAVPMMVWIIALATAVTVNFSLSVIFAGSIHEVFNSVSSRANEAQHFAKLFHAIERFEANSQRLVFLQHQLKSSDSGGIDDVEKLQLRLGLANMRRNGVLFLVYVVLEFLFFWDAHALWWLEKWKMGPGQHANRWFDSLGQWEALCALAKLAADQPDWTFPKVIVATDDESTRVEGKSVAHPLLDRSRVANDVQVGPPGTVLLVTGSNMSGKSTLLRAVGANVVLGQMGSVVCAAEFLQPTLQIESSMRIADSLSEGVSFFMAELKRLKEVVDTAEQIKTDGNPRRMMFLLDEILQGTNSRERQIAVSQVVRKLIDLGAIGAISTHDLDLGTTDELAAACIPVYFSEQFNELDGKKEMTFDYQMKMGIAETTNALKLLELVGLR